MLEIIILLVLLSLPPKEVKVDIEEEEEAVKAIGYNYIRGCLNQTLNRVIYANRINGWVILITRAN